MKQIEEIVHLNETIKEEKIHFETVGDLKIIGDDPEENIIP
jgi:hypothetical protein